MDRYIDPVKVHAAKSDPFGRTVDLQFWQDRPGGRAAIVRDVTLETVEAHEAPPITPIRLRNDDAQALCDQLYALGFRPTDGEDARGRSDHLADMRKLVAHAYDVPL